jgi:membrane protein HdeD
MQKIIFATILIILGLITIAFPILGLIPIAFISGFLVLMLGTGILLAGILKMNQSEGESLGIPLFILGIIILILGIGLIFTPALFGWASGFIVWIMGISLIIAGIFRIVSNAGDNRCGVKDISFGLLILIVELFLTTYIWFLGVLIGLWLITTGMRILYNPDLNWFPIKP